MNESTPTLKLKIARTEFDISKVNQTNHMSQSNVQPVSLFAGPVWMDVWNDMNSGDAFVITWSEKNGPIQTWQGTKADHLHAKYAGTLLQFPPNPDEFIVISIHPLVNTKKRLRISNVSKKMAYFDYHFESNSLYTTASLMAKIPSRRSLPYCTWRNWSQIVTSYLKSALDSDNIEHWMRFFCLPKLYLDRRVPNRSINDHLSDPFVITKHMSSMVDKEVLSEEEKKIDRAKKLYREGFYRKSVMALNPQKISSNKDFIQQKFITMEEEDRVEYQGVLKELEELTMSPTIQWEDKRIKTAVQRLGNGAAPCFGGWTKELLSAAMHYNSDLTRMIGELCVRLLDGTLPEPVLQYSLMGKYFGIEKDEQDPSNVRPIIIGELFWKIVGGLAMSNNTIEMAGNQYGIKHPLGVSGPILKIREKYAKNINTAIATFDIVNAFNTAKRLKVAKALLEGTDRATMKYFLRLYAKPSVYLSPAGLNPIIASDGFRQGDLLSSLFFCMVYTKCINDSWKEAYENFHTDFPTETLELNDSLFLYMDDASMAENPEFIKRFILVLPRHLQPFGLKVNFKKSHILADRLSPSDVVFFQEQNMDIKHGCIRILGSPIGTIDECRKFCTSKVQKYEKTFFECMVNISIPFQMAIHLLSICGVPKFLHLALSNDSSIVLEAARLFDSFVDLTFLRIMRHPQMPTLLSMSQKICVGILPYAHTSECFYKYTLSKMHQYSGTTVNVYNLHEDIRKTLLSVILELDPFQSIRVNSILNHASSWWVHPAYPFSESTMSQTQFRDALMIRMGIPFLNMPDKCSCGQSLECKELSIHHLLTCNHNFEYTKTNRHNDVNNEIVAVAKELGAMLPTREPINWLTTNHLRPDIKFNVNPEVVTDFEMIDPFTYADDIAKARDEKLLLPQQVCKDFNVTTHLDKAAKQKEAKYQQVIEQNNDTKFFPIIMDTYGAMHAQTFTFVNRLSTQVHAHDQRAFKYTMLYRIAQEAQKGNSKILRTAVERMKNTMVHDPMDQWISVGWSSQTSHEI